MKTNYISILASVVMIAVLAGCGNTTVDKATQLEKLRAEQTQLAKKIAQLEKEIKAENPDAYSAKAKDVSVSELAPRKFDHYVQTQGSVESIENILVSAKSAGIITSVFVREGDYVTRGQSMGQIDNTLIIRGIEELKSQLELAKTVYERQKNLWDQKIGTEVQFLQAKTNKESLERRLASLNEQNEMTRIKSPIDGVIDEVQLRVGQNIAPGMPAARVVNNERLRIKANVSEAYISKVKKGNKVLVNIPDLNKEFEATVTFAGRNINQLSRSFNVEVQLPSRPEFRPNMTAVVKIVYETYPSVIVVPVNVIQEVNGEKIVYVAETTGKATVARKKVVTVDGIFDNQAQVNGLAAGDKVITVGYQGLNDGDPVKI